MKVIRFLLLFFLVCWSFLEINGQNYSFYKPEINDWFPSRIYNIIQDKKGYYWLGSEFGVSRFDNLRTENFGTQNGLAKGGVYSLLEDTAGRIWFGHLRGGISIFDGEKFTRIRLDSDVLNSDIKSLKQANGYIWIRSADNKIIRAEFPSRGDTVLTAKIYFEKNGLGNIVYSDFISPEFEYFALCNTGIKRYDSEKDSFVKFAPDGINDTDTLEIMYSDSKTNYWYALLNGDIIFMDKFNAKATRYHNVFGKGRVRVTRLFEGSRGYIWAGSSGKGVARISEKEITLFNETNGLEALYINSITEDAENNILITGEYKGLFVFLRNNIFSFSVKNGLSDNDILSFAEDNNNSYWVGTGSKLNIISPDSFTGSMNRFTVKDVPEKIKATDIKKDSYGNLWFFTSDKLIWKFNIEDGKLKTSVALNRFITENGGSVTGPEIDKHDIIWLGVENGIISWDDQNKKGKFYQLDYNPVSLSAGFDDRIWVVTEESKLYKINSSNGIIEMTDLGVDIYPTVIAEEITGNLLIGTANNGVFILTEGKISAHLNKTNGLVSDYITALKVNKNDDVFIGTPEGLYIIGSKNKSLILISKNTGLADDFVNHNAISFDNEGFTWVGTKGGVTRIPADLSLLSRPAPLPFINHLEINSKVFNPDSLSNLKHSENNIVFQIGSGSFSNPVTLRYSAKLEGLNKDFIDYGNSNRITYSSLDPGDYTFILVTKNDSGNTSDELRFAFTILKPWWNTTAARITYIFLIIIVFYSFMKFRERKLQKDKDRLEKIVEERTAEVVEQRDLIANQKKDITDSINYALRIQTSLMPPEDYFKSVLKDYFVFYKPRDILSGDFYWIGNTDSQIIVVGADCTGHGVPGSLLSMLGLTYLDEIVKAKPDINPGEIIDRLRGRLLHAFKNIDKNSSMKDGMDIAVVSYNHDKKNLTYAGAKNSLYHIKNGQLTEYKADRDPITMAGEIKKYTDNKIDADAGDIIYIFSDGFADQFGGPLNKKYGYARMRTFLENLNSIPMSEQKIILEKEFEAWIGDNHQVDDVMILGFRLL